MLLHVCEILQLWNDTEDCPYAMFICLAASGIRLLQGTVSVTVIDTHLVIGTQQ